MIPIKAHTYETKTYIGGKAYRTGEILTSYLNRDFSPLIRYYQKATKLPQRIYGAKDVRSFYAAIEAGQRFMTYVDECLAKVPLYNGLIRYTPYMGNKLLSLYETSRHLFEMVDSSYLATMKSWEYRVKGDDEAYGYDDEQDEYGDREEYDDEAFLNRHSRRHSTSDNQRMLTRSIDEDNDYYASVEDEYGVDGDKSAFRRRVEELFAPYFTFVEDVVRVGEVYAPLLDQYIHTGAAMPDAADIATVITRFGIEQEENRHKAMVARKSSILYGEAAKLLPAEGVTIAYESVPVDMQEGKQNVLCQTITYQSLGAFLYQELMTGLLSGMPPKRCKNCGKFFLLQNGYYSDYCERIAPGETSKICRDVGARKRFDEKVKQDPVWLAYQRAYKAHYARVMKKKMSKPDFAEWTDMAIALRGKALNNEIAFEEFLQIIKK